jgi:hypothetical protein
MAGFYVNQFFRPAASEIVGSLSNCMLVESPGDVESDAGIKRIVGTEDDINSPVHIDSDFAVLFLFE